MFAASPFVAEVCEQDPARFERWKKAGWFDRQYQPGVIAAALKKAVAACDEREALMAVLRQFRREQMARIAWRDLGGLGSLDETLAAVSELADAACQAALEHAQAQLAETIGKPMSETGKPSRPIILGMGKLGGAELNFSSDIDLIMAYTEPGETTGPRVVANEQYFERLAREFTRLLGAITEDGFVFRVDWMLRPYGASGPPAMSVSAMVDYYEAHGREWERYALIKARVVAGDPEVGGTLLRSLRPFIYRRYLDYNAIGALREMKRLIEGEVERRELQDNLKLGEGGIREVEFIGQAFQLMRGGQESGLRSTQLRPVLRYLGEHGYLPEKVAGELISAYEHLRRVENAVQMRDDQQVHEIPEEGEARKALAAALGEPSWSSLSKKNEAVRKQVRKEFSKLFAESRRDASPADDAVAVVWSGGDAARAEALLEELGYGEDAEKVVDAVEALRDAPLVRTLSETSRQRLPQLVASVLSDACAHKPPTTAAQRTLQVLTAVAGRSTYLTLLRENSGAREQLLRLCGASPWITDLLSDQPILLDQLLDARTLYAPPDRAQMADELAKALRGVARGDTEMEMDTIRHLQQELMLRVAAADLVDALPLVKVSDHLTWLAEVVVEQTLARVREEMEQQHGLPYGEDRKPCRFGIIAYGKFGGIEMSYGSDLDVMFMHDCDQLQEMTRGGKKPIPNEMWLSRLAQRVIHWLSTQTAAGRAYEVDLELRPDGRRGMAVTSIRSFGEYQAEHAWTWEHQALTRARFVAGDAEVGQAFAEVRRGTLTTPRPVKKLRQDVIDMRAKMREHLDKSDKDGFDIKHGQGGLTDIEFITQFLVLRHAPKHPQVLDWSDHWRQTDALAAARVLKTGDAEALIAHYRTYRAMIHEHALARTPAKVALREVDAVRKAIAGLWERYLGN